ncbi:zinc transporter ZntB [Phaeobacter inhibens]|uniref:zinc transporter ZntB n=1 Tax=Phaeobacter inhibens TaxID=221822 RepID=UPI0021A84C0E|nr:zinc transporter ZntB [Phaeobacter inhibens]UWR91914.1 zinc transporter ZntB [Phaeobacter inhibens]
MDMHSITPIAAFDVEKGKATAIGGGPLDLNASQGYRWIHVNSQDEALRPWAKEHLPDIAARALWQSETRPRCERLDDGLILNLRGVNLNPESDPEDMVSLRMWITEHAIVSARIRKVWALDSIRQSAEAGAAPETAGKFLAELTYGLTSRIETVSLGLEEQTDELEEAIAEGKRIPTGKLGDIRQAVIKMRRFINPQREAISMLATLENWIIAPDELALLRETANRTRRIVEELDATRDRLSALRDHIDADRAHALSRNSYVLSVVAAIFLPLGFLTGLFGVNVAGMPGTTAPSAFWVLAGVSAVAGLALFLIFKFAKWL